MYRGSTPTIVINLPEEIDLDTMIDIWVTFKNFYSTFTLKLSKTQIEIDNVEKKLTMRLTQEQTLSMGAGDVKVQARFLTMNNECFSSNVMTTNVRDILSEGEMTNVTTPSEPGGD